MGSRGGAYARSRLPQVTFCSAVASAAYSGLSLSALDAALMAKLRDGIAVAGVLFRDSPKACRRSALPVDAKVFMLPDCRHSPCSLLAKIARAAGARLIDTLELCCPQQPDACAGVATLQSEAECCSEIEYVRSPPPLCCTSCCVLRRIFDLHRSASRKLHANCCRCGNFHRLQSDTGSHGGQHARMLVITHSQTVRRSRVLHST